MLQKIIDGTILGGVLFIVLISTPSLSYGCDPKYIDCIPARPWSDTFTKSYAGINYDPSNWQPGWWKDATGNNPDAILSEDKEDRCSDQYKKWANSACRSTAGHNRITDNSMCVMSYGARISSAQIIEEVMMNSALRLEMDKRSMKKNR